MIPPFAKTAIAAAMDAVPVALWQKSAETAPEAITQPEEHQPMHGAEQMLPAADMPGWLAGIEWGGSGDSGEMQEIASQECLFDDDPKREQAAAVKTIGARMRQARELCNLSQSAAARRLGYANPSKLSKVELATDTNSVPLWLIVRAARVYEVSVDYLFGVADDWETGVCRGVQGWMFDVWEKFRQRDLASLEHLHAEIAAVSTHLTAVAAGAHEVAQALDTLRARNPAFDDMPASGTLAGRLERLQERARAGELALKRFRLNLRPGAESESGQ